MNRAHIIYAGIGLGILIALFWKREDGSSVAEDIGSTITEGVQSVYFGATQDSKANEDRYADAIAQAERDNGIPNGLWHRQLFQESHFRSDIIGTYPDGSIVPEDKRTISGANAQGIAQIVPRWHPGVDPWNVSQSIAYGAKYLAQLYSKFGTWEAALAAYNWGPGNVKNYLAANNGTLELAGLPTETRRYVLDITSDVSVA